MLYDFSDRDFFLVMQSVENYNRSCLELIKINRDRGLSLGMLSSLVCVQRAEYGLEELYYSSYRGLLMDSVVSGAEYFFSAENLRLVLSVLVAVYEGVGSCLDYECICRICMGAGKVLSFSTGFRYDVTSYLGVVRKFV